MDGRVWHKTIWHMTNGDVDQFYFDTLCSTVIPFYDKHAKSPFLFSLGKLLETGAESSLQRKRRQSQDSLQPYIAAKLDALPTIFILGDEKKYNNYYNKPLPGEQQYLCFVLADLMDNDSVSGQFSFKRS